MHSVALEKPDGTDGTWSLGLTASSKIHRFHRQNRQIRRRQLVEVMPGCLQKH